MSSKKQKALLIIFGLFIALGISEALFRIGSFLVVQRNEKLNHKGKNVYNILCLGDSTTWTGT